MIFRYCLKNTNNIIEILSVKATKKSEAKYTTATAEETKPNETVKIVAETGTAITTVPLAGLAFTKRKEKNILKIREQSENLMVFFNNKKYPIF